ncbi:hypothetical protein HDU76_008905 [Blyttiomyces sp. JEL0837]|nr:hypothetical protein HDU76_008905 [Blyttiomyces sp. JEL0837]
MNRQQQQSQVNLLNIPEEVALHILDFLPLRDDCLSLALCSPSWLRLISSVRLWSTLHPVIEGPGLKWKQIDHMLQIMQLQDCPQEQQGKWQQSLSNGDRDCEQTTGDHARRQQRHRYTLYLSCIKEIYFEIAEPRWYWSGSASTFERNAIAASETFVKVLQVLASQINHVGVHLKSSPGHRHSFIMQDNLLSRNLMDSLIRIGLSGSMLQADSQMQSTSASTSTSMSTRFLEFDSIQDQQQQQRIPTTITNETWTLELKLEDQGIQKRHLRAIAETFGPRLKSHLVWEDDLRNSLSSVTPRAPGLERLSLVSRWLEPEQWSGAFHTGSVCAGDLAGVEKRSALRDISTHSSYAENGWGSLLKNNPKLKALQVHLAESDLDGSLAGLSALLEDRLRQLTLVIDAESLMVTESAMGVVVTSGRHLEELSILAPWLSDPVGVRLDMTRLAGLKSLTLQGLKCDLVFFVELARCCSLLESLEVSVTWIDDVSLHCLSRNCGRLKNLSISFATELSETAFGSLVAPRDVGGTSPSGTNAGHSDTNTNTTSTTTVKSLICRFPNVETLRLSRVRNLRLFYPNLPAAFPRLRNLDLSNMIDEEVVEAILHHHHVYQYNGHHAGVDGEDGIERTNFVDAEAEAEADAARLQALATTRSPLLNFATAFPTITSLNLSFNMRLQDQDILHITRSAPNLTHLTLIGCEQLTYESLLHLGRAAFLSSPSTSTITFQPRPLSSLDISGCKCIVIPEDLEEIDKYSPRYGSSSSSYNGTSATISGPTMPTPITVSGIPDPNFHPRRLPLPPPPIPPPQDQQQRGHTSTTHQPNHQLNNPDPQPQQQTHRSRPRPNSLTTNPDRLSLFSLSLALAPPQSPTLQEDQLKAPHAFLSLIQGNPNLRNLIIWTTGEPPRKGSWLANAVIKLPKSYDDQFGSGDSGLYGRDLVPLENTFWDLGRRLRLSWKEWHRHGRGGFPMFGMVTDEEAQTWSANMQI